MFDCVLNTLLNIFTKTTILDVSQGSETALTILTNSSILDVWQDFEHILNYFNKELHPRCLTGFWARR